MPQRVTDLERVHQLAQAITEGKIRPDENYSADELASILGWHPKTVKRIAPLVVAARELPENLEWKKKRVGDKVFYNFRVGTMTPKKE